MVGLGALGLGIGGIVGAGAFDSIDADREVTVAFDDDSDAVLTMVPNPDREFSDSGIQVTENDDGEISIEVLSVNRNARATFTDLIEFTNNGTQDIASLSFSADVETSHGSFAIYPDDDDILDGSLDVGESVVGLGFEIETRESVTGDTLPENTDDIEMSGTITVSAAV